MTADQYRLGMQLDFRTNKWRETQRPLNNPQHCMTEYSASVVGGGWGIGEGRKERKMESALGEREEAGGSEVH